MKPILFLGCSFTWGQGLWFYGDFEFTDNQKTNTFEYENFSQNLIDYKNIHRFPRLVSEHFETCEVVKLPNGGTNTQSITILEKIIDGIQINNSHLYTSYDINHFSHIVFQFTQEHRGYVSFDENDKEYIISLRDIFSNEDYHKKYWDAENELQDHNFLKRYEHVSPNYYKNINILVNKKSLLDKVIKQELDYINNNLLPRVNRLGIPMFFLSWPRTYSNVIEKDYPNIFEKFITFDYKQKNYTNLHDLMEINRELCIANCPEISHINTNDEHPSKKCHQVIADSIISHIEKNENNISNG